jgi:hypothetical protein
MPQRFLFCDSSLDGPYPGPALQRFQDWGLVFGWQEPRLLRRYLATLMVTMLMGLPGPDEQTEADSVEGYAGGMEAVAAVHRTRFP